MDTESLGVSGEKAAESVDLLARSAATMGEWNPTIWLLIGFVLVCVLWGRRMSGY